MPVTLLGDACSQPEHPQSSEPTELSGTELRLNREARSPWTRTSICHLSTHPSVEPSPANTAIIVSFLSPFAKQRFCWGMLRLFRFTDAFVKETDS